MGQYYRIIFLKAEDSDSSTKATVDIIECWTEPHAYEEGSKLMEHSYLNTDMMKDIEYHLSPEGALYRSRLVWAGDYAVEEKGRDMNLYHMCKEESSGKKMTSSNVCYTTDCQYILNHTKKQYVDKKNLPNDIHPLPLLTSDGNGAGSGDFRGTDEILCGDWARDVISMERVLPEGYTELVCRFEE